MNNELINYDNDEMSLDQMAELVTGPEDYLCVRQTKRGRSTKLVKNGNSVTRLEMKKCTRYYVTKRKTQEV